MKLKANLRADAAILLTTLIWGSTFVITKDILDYWPPLAYMAVRMTFAALVFAALFPKTLTSASRSEWRAGATLGVLIGGGFAARASEPAYRAAPPETVDAMAAFAADDRRAAR